MSKKEKQFKRTVELLKAIGAFLTGIAALIAAITEIFK